MNIIKKIILMIKNVFIKQDKIKKIEEPIFVEKENQKVDFVKNLKIDNINESNENKIETLICYGDGLGIQKKVSY